MAISYRVAQNTMKGTKYYNKYYGKAVILGKVTTDDLCEEIAHSTTITEADARAFMAELKVVLKAHLCNSQKVIVDGLGTFRPSIKTSMVDDKKDFNATKITKYRIRFEPEKKFVATSELTEKGHRKGAYVYKILEGATAQVLPGTSDTTTDSSSSSSDDSSSSGESSSTGNG